MIKRQKLTPTGRHERVELKIPADPRYVRVVGEMARDGMWRSGRRVKRTRRHP